ncbi:MAG TPA: NrfD/PsrC family molybdoenzyme membrane anchor subunit [Acidimicrobiales bacterium]|nr:NrfD/PsrC family molybdoenzyme membrane anchor subunit [Acidimicrobiales bacterium]
MNGEPRRGGGGGGERAMVPDAKVLSYYDQPVLKPPVWRWPIPAYFFAGGLAGASATLALAARVTGNDRLARRALLASSAAIAVSPVLLVEDLGRPERFANMLRVLKPTSPMNTGAWLLAVMGPAVAGATASDLTGAARRTGRGLEMLAGALGPVLATYTAVVVSDTAVPAWHEARRELPFVFAAGSAASAGAAATLLTPGDDGAPARRMAVVGALAALAAARAMVRAMHEEVAAPYRTGRAARLSRWAEALSAGGAALLALSRRRPLAMAGAGAVLAGTAVERFAVAEAGAASARDPRATVGAQRRRMAGREPPHEPAHGPTREATTGRTTPTTTEATTEPTTEATTDRTTAPTTQPGGSTTRSPPA